MSTIEERLNRLERDNRRYRLGLSITLGCLGFVMASGFGQVQPGSGQQQRNIVADSITVQTISAYSGTINLLGTNNLTAQTATMGPTQAESLVTKACKATELSSARAQIRDLRAESLRIANQRGGEGVVLSGDDQGGSISIFDSAGNIVGYWGATEGNGLFRILGTGGYTALELSANKRSGTLKTMSSFGKPMASLGRNDKGDGEIVAHTRNGNRVVVLSSDDQGQNGKLIVQTEGASPGLTIEIGSLGGLVKTWSGEKVTSQMPPSP